MMTKNRRPNLLFVFADQQHYQAAGFMDGSFHTPNLDSLTSQSTRFTHAFCTTPQCSPSRAAIFTGLYPSKTGVLVPYPLNPAQKAQDFKRLLVEGLGG